MPFGIVAFDGTQPVGWGLGTQVTGNITGASSILFTQPTGDPYSSVIFEVSGTYAGAILFFESKAGSGVLYPVRSQRIGTNIIETGTDALTNVSRAWVANIAGMNVFQIRCSAFTSGTCAVRISPTAAPIPLFTQEVTSAASTLTNIAASTTSQAAAVKDLARRRLMLHHKAGSGATASAFVAVGSTVASLTSFSVELVPGAYFESLEPMARHDVIWDTAGVLAGSKVYVTEIS